MDKEIKIAGKKIFYRVDGKGKPVMLVHGFGETGDVWNNQAPLNPPAGKASLNPSTGGTLSRSLQQDFNQLMQERFLFIVPDLPGSGKSEMIDDMSMEGMADVLKEILDKENDIQHSGSEIPPVIASEAKQAGGGAAILIGHSMGGYITLAFAEKYPNYLSAFGLFHSTAFPDTDEKKATRRKGIEFIKEHGAFEFLKTSTPNLFSPITKEQSPQLVHQFIQGLDNFTAESLVSYYEAMIKRPDRVHVLKETTLPVLFVAGEYDSAIPLQDILKQCHLPNKSYFHVLQQSGHMGMLEETGKSNRLLVEFLNQS